MLRTVRNGPLSGTRGPLIKNDTQSWDTVDEVAVALRHSVPDTPNSYQLSLSVKAGARPSILRGDHSACRCFKARSHVCNHGLALLFHPHSRDRRFYGVDRLVR